MVSRRISSITPSATVELTGKIASLRRQGISVISFSVGEPDFDTPANIADAAQKAVAQGFTKYTEVAGILELREAVSRKFERDNEVVYEPDDIVVSNGGKQALFNALFTVCDPGDEVILPTPCWVSYAEMVKLADAKVVFVPTDEESGFQMDLEKIQEAITDQTKAIILNTPNNPTGAVYSEESLRELGRLAVENDFFIIADEIYEKLIYDGAKHISIASLSQDIKDKTITINGLSKAYAMTGWRLGYAAGPSEVVKGMKSLQGHITHAPNSITQKAAIEALDGPQDACEHMRQEFDRRRKCMYERLGGIDGIRCAEARGAFYLMPNVSSLFGKKYRRRQLKDSLALADFLLEEAYVAVVPGVAFEAPQNIRLSYSTSLEKVEEGTDRMQRAFSRLE